MNNLIDAAGAQFWNVFKHFSANVGHIYPLFQCRLLMQYCRSFCGEPLWNFVTHSNMCTVGDKTLKKMCLHL